MRDLHAVLRQYWGYDSFRSCQEEVIRWVLEGNDALVVMTTGGGKSMCYQVPPVVTNKVAVVISPLISLMEDQVLALNARGLGACYLGSTQHNRKVKEDAWKGAYPFVYMTPELAVNSLDSLSSLHHQCGICLVAIDEAHCVSEWGHDFRPEFRRLALLKTALPDTPFLALTATANKRVQDDIVSNLQLRSHQQRRWVTGFERPNLDFSVTQRERASSCYEPLLQAWRMQGTVEPTLIYALTVKEVEEIVAQLASHGMGQQVLMYHAKLPASQRKDNHAAFLNDDVSVMVATVAYGMGIDKPNIRCIIHAGCPSSMEAYYQQAGRAGRDGGSSRCHLFWTHADVNMNESLKRSGFSMHGSQHDPYQERRNTMISFCSSTNCRHADLVNYFQPGSLPPGGPCAGGCDNCKRRAAGRSSTRDFGPEATLLLATLKQINGFFGIAKASAVLRGSMAQGMPQHLLKLQDPSTGKKLHGAGKKMSDNWWKGLATLLVGEGMVSTQAKRTGRGSGTFVVYHPTAKGMSFLNKPAPLVLAVPPNMQESPAVQMNEARQLAHCAEVEEVAKLEALLRARRKEVADGLGHAPTSVVTEATLLQLARLRPASLAELGQVPGISEAALKNYGQRLLQVVLEFCAKSNILKHGMQWISKGGNMGGAAAALPIPTLLTGSCAPLAKKLLGEPKGAALDAYHQFVKGEQISDIAMKRQKGPIQVSTVVGYLSDCAGAGYPFDFAEAARQCGLTEHLARAVAKAALEHGDMGLSAVKNGVQAAEYGHVKLTIAMMAAAAHWFAPKLEPCDELDLAGDGGPPSNTSSGPNAKQQGAEFMDQNALPPYAPSPIAPSATTQWFSRKAAATAATDSQPSKPLQPTQPTHPCQPTQSPLSPCTHSSAPDANSSSPFPAHTASTLPSSNTQTPTSPSCDLPSSNPPLSNSPAPMVSTAPAASQHSTSALHTSTSLSMPAAHTSTLSDTPPHNAPTPTNSSSNNSGPNSSGPNSRSPNNSTSIKGSLLCTYPSSTPSAPTGAPIPGSWFSTGPHPSTLPTLRLPPAGAAAVTAASQGAAPSSQSCTPSQTSTLPDDMDPIPCLTPIQPEDNSPFLSQQGTLAVQGERGETFSQLRVGSNGSIAGPSRASLSPEARDSKAGAAGRPTTAPADATMDGLNSEPLAAMYPAVRLVKRAAPSFLGGARKKGTSIPIRDPAPPAPHKDSAGSPEDKHDGAGAQVESAAVAGAKQRAGSTMHEKAVLCSLPAVRQLLEAHGPMTAPSLLRHLGAQTEAESEHLCRCLQELVDAMEVVRKGGKCMSASIDMGDQETLYLLM